MSVGAHDDARYQGNDEECTEVDEQKKSGLDLFYLGGISAIVKIAREDKVGGQIGRPLCCVKDTNRCLFKLSQKTSKYLAWQTRKTRDR